METEKNTSDTVGPLIGSVLIILIIIAGAFYLFSTIRQKVDSQKETQAKVEEVQSSDSDEISDIEADINSTEVDSMNEDLESLQVEFQI